MPRRKRKMKLPSRRNGTLVPDDEDSDSDLQEFSLPKKRIIKPGKSTYVARRRCGCCRVCASVFLSVLLIASVLCVVVLGWFSLRLKRDLDFMRRRLSKVESFDRSTSREYESLNNDLTQKYESLKASKEKAIKQDDEQYKSILKQIAHLNSTVDQLQKKMKLPESASTITQDIDSLKKGMADTGGDITEIKDKIKQLTSLASQQNGKVEDLSKKVFNLSVQVAHVMGKPTPKTPKNTGTPPLILRMPVSDDGEQQTEDQSLMKNVTAQISVEVARVMGIVTSVNHTLSHDVSKLRVLMKSLVAEVKKHVTTLDELQTKVSQNLKPNHSSVVSRGHLEADSEGVSEQVFNLSLAVTKLSDDVEQHSKNLAELMLEVVQINTTVFKYQHQDAILDKPAPCNCSAEVGKVWEQLSSNKLSIESVQKELQALQKPVTVQPTNTSAVVTTEASISDDKQNTENQSSAESIASETDKDIEQDELEAENVKQSPTPESNTSVSVVEVVKVTEPPVTASPSGNDNSTLHSTQTSNTTASPQVALVNSTNNNQTSSSDQKVEVIKLATPSSEEEVENKLESPGSD